MKALFTVLFIAFLGLQNAFAQNKQILPYEPWVPVRTVSFKGGVNVASISNLANSGAFLGFHAGFVGELQPREDFGYGAEVLYSKQGVTVDNVDYGLSYFSLPLFLNLHHGKITFQGGGYGSVLFMATAKIGPDKIDITNDFETTDYGLLLGLRYSPFSQTFVSARFNLGMQNINSNFGDKSDVPLRNRNIQIGGGYQF